MPMGSIPSPFTTTQLAVEIVFLLLATVAVVVRIYSSRLTSKSRWLTIDLFLIVAALIVTYGCIIATITGAAVVGLDSISDRLSLVESSQFTFKVHSTIQDLQRTVHANTTPDLSVRCYNYDSC